MSELLSSGSWTMTPTTGVLVALLMVFRVVRALQREPASRATAGHRRRRADRFA